MVLPISFFEKANNAFYNSLVVIDADGSIASHYRKSHIPDGPGYQEKWYFTPGDTGPQTFGTSGMFCMAHVGRVTTYIGELLDVLHRRFQAHQDKVRHHRCACVLGPVVPGGRQGHGAPGGRGAPAVRCTRLRLKHEAA